jgi:hypothetical protein
MDATSHNGDLKRIVTSDIVDPKIRKSSQIGLNQPFESVDSEANHTIRTETRDSISVTLCYNTSSYRGLV